MRRSKEAPWANNESGTLHRIKALFLLRGLVNDKAVGETIPERQPDA